MVPAALSATVAGTLAAAPAARRVKVAVVIVAAFTGLLNVAVTVLARGTPVAPFGGAWAITVGATSVVKLHVEAVPSGVPMALATVPATLTVTVAGTGAAAPAAVRVKVAVVIVAEFIAVLNVAVTVVVSGTLIAPGVGA